MKSRSAMLRCVFVGSFMVVPLATQAETETTQLDVEMGIAEAITFSCDTHLSFGVTRIPLKGDSAGEITIAATESLDISSDGSDDFILDDKRAQPGECELSGSVAETGTEITVSFPDGSAEMSGDPVLNLEAGGLANPEITLSSSSEQVDEDGAATIYIGGTLQLKEGELDSGDYGGYSVTMDVEVDI